MEKEQLYNNFIDLFNDNDSVKMNALLYKSKWILDKFYIAYKIKDVVQPNDFSSMDCLQMFALKFGALDVPQNLDKKTSTSISLFNKNFMYSKIYTELPERPDKNTFFVEVDFRKLKKPYYKQLVASFFYCVDLVAPMDQYEASDIRSVFTQAIKGNENEAVIILPKKKLDHNFFEINGFTKMYIYNDITDFEEMLLKKTAQRLNLETVQVYG